MEITYLMFKTIGFKKKKKIFHLSHVLFELSDFEDGATGKS